MNLSPEELRKMFDRPIGKCAYDKCGKIVTSLQEHRVTPGGVYHTDCYFEAWGDEVEQHPIGAGRIGVMGSNLTESDLEAAASA